MRLIDADSLIEELEDWRKKLEYSEFTIEFNMISKFIACVDDAPIIFNINKFKEYINQMIEKANKYKGKKINFAPEDIISICNGIQEQMNRMIKIDEESDT